MPAMDVAEGCQRHRPAEPSVAASADDVAAKTQQIRAEHADAALREERARGGLRPCGEVTPGLHELAKVRPEVRCGSEEAGGISPLARVPRREAREVPREVRQEDEDRRAVRAPRRAEM